MGCKKHLLVCSSTGCHASDSDILLENLRSEIAANGLEEDVQAFVTGCFGFCEKGPIVKVYPDDVFYIEVKPEDAKEIVEEHLIKGNRVTRLFYEEPSTGEVIPKHHEMPFYKKQLRIALRNCGLIDPENIQEYFAADGYQALGTVLTSMTTTEVIDEIKKSGLRGRGGGGFPTGLKWSFATNYKSDIKYVVCNADEGDPGAFMDRSILEGDPHSVLEAMAIAGYAIGASVGYVYVRAEYPLAIKRLEIAIAQAREMGMLGENIFNSGFCFDIELKLGAGAFVCGEETALIRSIQGERGEPKLKPPFPAESGVWGKPTIVNNVETLANIPAIINQGAAWFASIGTERSKGTKVFALAGNINNVGLVEVPMGITLREIVFEIGGGIKNGKGFKAVQTGGPSGGCISAEFLDIPIEYDTLTQIGSMMGSGGMIVLDEDTCMVNIAKFYLDFIRDESCGKCIHCRMGTKRMLEILERITEGKGKSGDMELLESLAVQIKDGSMCGLGQTAPNPVLSTLKYFRNEYETHIHDKKCPTKQCKNLLTYSISENCVGCTVCAKNCPVDAIAGTRKEVHVIDQETCIKCGKCFEVCRFDAVVVD